MDKNSILDENNKINVDFGEHKPFINHEGKK